MATLEIGMLETIKQSWQAKVAVALFLFFFFWWVSFQLPAYRNDFSIQIFGSTYAVMAAWGAIWGILIAKPWGFFKSIMGRALLMFALGLLAQVFGQIAYSYYIYVLGVEIPYPSWGDLGYFGSIPFYIYGVVLLAHASGVKVSLQSLVSKVQALLIPAAMLGFSYYVFLQGYEFDWQQPLTIFLDFGYPLGQAVYISFGILTYLLTRGILGGIMKPRILFLLFALLLQYLADWTFLYQVSNGIWQLGGSNELMYLTAYFVMTIALLQLQTVYRKMQD